MFLLLNICKSFYLADLPQLQSLKETKFGSSLLENMSLALGQLNAKETFISPEMIKGAKIIKDALTKNNKEKLENNKKKENYEIEYKKAIDLIIREIKELSTKSESLSKRMEFINQFISENEKNLLQMKTNLTNFENQYKHVNSTSANEVAQLQNEIKQHQKIEDVLNRTEIIMRNMLNSTSGKNVSEHIEQTNSEKRDISYVDNLDNKNIDQGNQTKNENETQTKNETQTENQNQNKENPKGNTTVVDTIETKENTVSPNSTNSEPANFLQIPSGKNSENSAKDTKDTKDVRVSLLEIKIKVATKADQDKLMKLITLMKNFRFDTAIKRSQIKDSLQEKISESQNNSKFYINQINTQKNIIKELEEKIVTSKNELKEIKNSYDKISPLIDAKKNLKNLKEDQKKKFMDEYELTKVRLDSEYESFEKIRIFYLQSGLDIFNSKIFD